MSYGTPFPLLTCDLDARAPPTRPRRVVGERGALKFGSRWKSASLTKTLAVIIQRCELEKPRLTKKNGRQNREEAEDPLPPWVQDQWGFPEEAN